MTPSVANPRGKKLPPFQGVHIPPVRGFVDSVHRGVRAWETRSPFAWSSTRPQHSVCHDLVAHELQSKYQTLQLYCFNSHGGCAFSVTELREGTLLCNSTENELGTISIIHRQNFNNNKICHQVNDYARTVHPSTDGEIKTKER